MFRTPAEDARPLATVAAACRPSGKKRRQGGTSLWWVDLISRDLIEMTNWQEVVTDRSVCVFVNRCTCLWV